MFEMGDSHSGCEADSPTLSLELVADFNLIVPKHSRLWLHLVLWAKGKTHLSASRGGRIVPNRGHVIADVSKALVLMFCQLEEQFSHLR